MFFGGERVSVGVWVCDCGGVCGASNPLYSMEKIVLIVRVSVWSFLFDCCVIVWVWLVVVGVSFI